MRQSHWSRKPSVARDGYACRNFWNSNGHGENQDARQYGYIGGNHVDYTSQDARHGGYLDGNTSHDTRHDGNPYTNQDARYVDYRKPGSRQFRTRETTNTSSRGPKHANYRGNQMSASNKQQTSLPENGSEPAGEPVNVSQDQLYRKAILIQTDDDQWPRIIGTCPDMCPASERENRARLRDLAVFERLNNDHSRTSKELAVKKFCRTFTGKDLKQADIRPLPVLSQTMDHLMKILDKRDCAFELVHDFLFDRTRAIRQELSMQRLTDKEAITIIETIVRFHIVSERELRQQRVSGKAFDSHLNLQQLTKSLMNLLNLYITNGSDDDDVGNEAEFSCYYVLLNLSQAQQLSLWFKGARPALLRTDDMHFARNILRCYQQKNFCRFFRLARNASYLQSCLLELYFNEVRAYAVSVINHGAYKLHPYPLRDLSEILLMEEEDVEEFCLVHGLAVGVNASNDKQLLVKQAEFSTPKQGTKHYYCRAIQDKHPSSFEQMCRSNSSTLA